MFISMIYTFSWHRCLFCRAMIWTFRFVNLTFITKMTETLSSANRLIYKTFTFIFWHRCLFCRYCLFLLSLTIGNFFFSRRFIIIATIIFDRLWLLTVLCIILRALQ